MSFRTSLPQLHAWWTIALQQFVLLKATCTMCNCELPTVVAPLLYTFLLFLQLQVRVIIHRNIPF